MLFGLPTLYTALCHAEGVSDRDLGSLRLSISAAEVLSEEIYSGWMDLVGHGPTEGLGSTEMLHIYLSNRLDDHRLGAAGARVPGCEVKLLTPEGKPARPGEAGVMHVRLDCDLDVPLMRERYGDEYEDAHLADPDAVAQAYWWAHNQPKSAWSNEIEIPAPHREVDLLRSGRLVCQGPGIRPRFSNASHTMNNGASCLCGSVTWEITAEPFQAFNCHCKLCRKAHGSAFGTYWFMRPDEFRWTSDTDTIAHYRSSHLLTRSAASRSSPWARWTMTRG